jgi:hypothetical protein
MDVLHIIKEEYSTARLSVSNLPTCSDPSQRDPKLVAILRHLDMLIRVSDELILPELAESVTKGLEHLAEAGDQSSALRKLVASSLKSGRMGESRKRDVTSKLLNHLEHMEQHVLPIFRVKISTPVREELGLVALDFKGDCSLEPIKQRSSRQIGDLQA